MYFFPIRNRWKGCVPSKCENLGEIELGEIELFNNVVIDVIIKRCFFVLFTHHFSDIPSKSSTNVDVFSFSNTCVSWTRMYYIILE